MISLEAPFNSGLFAYVILLVMGLELLFIWAYHLVTRKGILPKHALANLGAGAAIVLAMGLMVEGAARHWIGLALIGSMLIHWVDLAHRWKAGSVD